MCLTHDIHPVHVHMIKRSCVHSARVVHTLFLTELTIEYMRFVVAAGMCACVAVIYII